MVCSEASIIAVFGALLGIAIGLFLAWAIIQALGEEGFDSFVLRHVGSLDRRSKQLDFKLSHYRRGEAAHNVMCSPRG